MATIDAQCGGIPAFALFVTCALGRFSRNAAPRSFGTRETPVLLERTRRRSNWKWHMDIHLENLFGRASLRRGRDCTARGDVLSVESPGVPARRQWVATGRGKNYRQHIIVGTGGSGFIGRMGSFLVGHNFRHVAATLITLLERATECPGLPSPVRGRPEPNPRTACHARERRTDRQQSRCHRGCVYSTRSTLRVS